LQSICTKPILIHQHIVVGRLVVTLQSSMTIQIKVKLGGVADALVNHSAGQAVAAPVLVVLISWEEAGVVVFGGHDVGYGGAVAFFKLEAGGTEGGVFLLAHL
jgi:hypothetical protein